MPGLAGRMSTVIKAKISKAARPRRGPVRDARLRLPEAGRAAPEREEGHRRRHHVEEAPSDAVRKARAAGGEARHPGPPGARAGSRRPRARRARAQDGRPRPSSSRWTSRCRSCENQQEALTENEKKLRAKIESFRTKKEVIKAQYSAAEAQVKISEAANGVGEEMADLGLAIQRAEDKTEQHARPRVRRRGARGGRDLRGHLAARVRPGRHRPPAGRAEAQARRWTTSWPR